MQPHDKIFVAGSHTLIGAALLRQLKQQGYANLVGDGSDEPVLSDAGQVEEFFARAKPQYVFVAGGKSGGIRANQKYPATLMLDNLLVETHVIDCSHRHGVRKLLYLASSCCYPKHCPQPMRPESLLTGPLEPTSEAYAIAKIAGLSLCEAYRHQYGQSFICAIAADVFGPGEEKEWEDLHVLPALLRRMHQAKLDGAPAVDIWGSGNPRREFTFADDLADACVLVMREYDSSELINIGVGEAISIKEIAELIREVVGYRGQLRFDTSKPDGMPVKLLDSTKLRELGWRPRTPLRAAVEQTYAWMLQQQGEAAHVR